MTRTIDLNADVGEGYPDDAALMAVISRASVACGGHAGDEETMARTLTLAKAHGVVCGAHPSYPDPEHFGRRSLDMSMGALAAALGAQTKRLCDVAERLGVTLDHLKPHGALYADAANDVVRADVIADVAEAHGLKTLLGPPKSALEAAAKDHDLRFLAEGFPDRAYLSDGDLTPRGEPGAVVSEPAAAAAQARLMVEEGVVSTPAGERIPLAVRTLCIHGDLAGAAARGAAVRKALEAAGLCVSAEA